MTPKSLVFGLYYVAVLKPKVVYKNSLFCFQKYESDKTNHIIIFTIILIQR